MVRPLTPADAELVATAIAGRWGAAEVVSRGRLLRPAELEGFVAEEDGRWIGLLTIQIRGEECEVVTLDSFEGGRGVGTRLLEAAVAAARAASCRRLWLITTNDNTQALRFYQRRGMRLVAVHRDAVAAARQLKPSIPEVGMDGIPLRDEVELEIQL